ncbi:hypothetical protein, partial [Nostoc sp.]
GLPIERVERVINDMHQLNRKDLMRVLQEFFPECFLSNTVKGIKQKTEIDHHLKNCIEIAKISSVAIIFLGVTFSVLNIIGISLLLTGHISAGTLTAVSGFTSTVFCMHLLQRESREAYKRVSDLRRSMHDLRITRR